MLRLAISGRPQSRMSANRAGKGRRSVPLASNRKHVSRQVETFSAATRSVLSLKFHLHSIFLFPTTEPDWSRSCVPKHRDRRWIKGQRSTFIAWAFALFVACVEPGAGASAPPRTVNASVLTMIFVIMDIDSRRLRSICRRGVVSICWFDRSPSVMRPLSPMFSGLDILARRGPPPGGTATAVAQNVGTAFFHARGGAITQVKLP